MLSFGRPPPPPQVMTSFMNSPLGMLKHRMQICPYRQLIDFDNLEMIKAKMNTDLDSHQMDFETLELKLIDGFIFGGAKLLFQCSFPKIRCIQMRKNSEN